MVVIFKVSSKQHSKWVLNGQTLFRPSTMFLDHSLQISLQRVFRNVNVTSKIQDSTNYNELLCASNCRKLVDKTVGNALLSFLMPNSYESVYTFLLVWNQYAFQLFERVFNDFFFLRMVMKLKGEEEYKLIWRNKLFKNRAECNFRLEHWSHIEFIDIIFVVSWICWSKFEHNDSMNIWVTTMKMNVCMMCVCVNTCLCLRLLWYRNP